MDLEVIKAALAKMTPRPWIVAGPFPTVTIYRDTPEDQPAEQVATIGEFHPDDLKNCTDEPDAVGIVAIVNAAPVLVAEVERLRLDLGAARHDYERLSAAVDEDAADIRAKDARIAALTEIVRRATNCLDAGSDKAARRGWAAELRAEAASILAAQPATGAVEK